MPINIDVDGRTIKTRTLRNQSGRGAPTISGGSAGWVKITPNPPSTRRYRPASTVKIVRVREEVLGGTRKAFRTRR